DPGRLVTATGDPLDVLPIRTATAVVGDREVWAAGDELIHYDVGLKATRQRRILPGPAVDLDAGPGWVTVLLEHQVLGFVGDLVPGDRGRDPIVGLWTGGNSARSLSAGGDLTSWNLTKNEA